MRPTRTLSRHFLPSAALLGVLVLAACDGDSLPGTMLGTYKVTANASSNTCGSGLDAPSPWTFDVQMSVQDSTTLYWSWMDGSAPLSGTLSTTTATVTDNTTVNVDATDAGAGPCTMVRSDSLAITLATGSPPGSFSATITYTFAAESGADCSDQLTSSGGSFDTLPCTLSYSATGARQ